MRAEKKPIRYDCQDNIEQYPIKAIISLAWNMWNSGMKLVVLTSLRSDDSNIYVPDDDLIQIYGKLYDIFHHFGYKKMLFMS